MADNETKIDVGIEVTANTNKAANEIKNIADVLDDVKKSADEANKSIEKLTKNTEKNAAKSTRRRSSKKSSSDNTEKIDEEINQDKERTSKAVNQTMSNAEAISKMSEEQLKIYEYELKTDRKRVNQSARRLRNAERNAQTNERAEERRQQNQKNLDKKTEAYVAYMQKRMESIEKNDKNKNRKYTPKYQAGRGLIQAGIYLGNTISKPVGNILSTGFELAGTSLANPAAGVAVGITQLSKAIVQLGKASTQAYGEIESIRTQLGVVYGNQTQADAAFSQLSQYATKSPFGVQQTAEIATLLKQSGVEQTQIMNTLKMLGDTAGGNMEKMKRIANNYAQIISIGKASMLDMRQFAYAGIPIFEKVAEELQVSQTSLRKMISDGKVTSDVIETVFKKMTDAGGLFYGATSKGAETLKARLQNLKDIKTLALSSIGEGLYRVGERTGGDSIAYRTIDFAEDFYTKLNEKTSLKNLEKSVESIKNVVNEKNNLEELLQYAKDTGQSKEVIKSLEDKISSLNKKRNPDKERSLLSNLYETYRGNESTKLYEVQDKKYREAYGRLEIEGYYPKMLEAASYNYVYKISRLNSILKVYEGKPEFEETYNDLINERKKITERYNEEILDLQKRKEIDELVYEAEEDRVKSLKELTEAQSKITDEMRLAYKETQIMQSQQTYLDTISSAGKKSNSVINDLVQMEELYKNTDEYKKKEQEDLKDRLTKSEGILKEISTHTGKGTNILNFGEVAGKKLTEYIEMGAVGGRKLATTLDTNGSSSDWIILQSQLKQARKAIEIIADSNNDKNLGQSIKDNVVEALESLEDKNSVSSFYSVFTNSYSSAARYAFNEFSSATTDDMRSFWKNIYDMLEQSLVEYSSAGEAPDWLSSFVEKTKNGKEPDIFQPLWKRIISQYTGIPSTAINGKPGEEGVKHALGFYSENLSTRSITGNVLSSMVKEGLSVDMIQKLTGYRTEKLTTKGTETPTWQIDWAKTREEMSKFVSALSSSTTAIDTWTSGLEQERNTYAELIGAGVLSAEQNNTGRAMYISAKKIKNEWLSSDDFGINAFGDKLINEDGEVVTAIRDGIAYGKDKDDKEYQLTNQNLMVTENIYNEVKEKLDSIDKELKEARKTQSYNKILSGMQGNVLNDLIIKSAAAGRGYGLTNLINSNTDEYRNILEQNLDITGFKNISEFYSAYLTGNDSAVARFNEALEKTNREVFSFVNNDLYVTLKELNDSIDKTKNLNNAYNTYQSLLAGKNKSPAGIGYEASLMSKFGMGGVSVKELSEYARVDNANKVDELNKLERDGSGNSERAKQLREEIKLSEQLTESKIKEMLAQQELNEAVSEMNKNVAEIAKQTAKDSFLSPFKTLGEDSIAMANGTKDWSDYLSDAGNSLKDIAGQMLSNMGSEMATAGFRIAAAAALKEDWGMVAAGLGLAAVGGFSSGLGSAVNNASQEDNKTEKEAEKLENIKSQLQDLLEQARTDALYYENNLRHKTALGINERYSYKKVNDAIITPNGVVNTHPEDYIIATKQPQNFMNGGTSIKINQIVNNNTGVKVTQTQRTNADGSIDLITTLDEAIGNYIASEKGDEAFNVREARLRGRTAIM